MRYERVFVIIFIIICIASFLYALLQGGPHQFSTQQCSICHISINTDPQKINGNISGSCALCHKDLSETISHPTDISPKIRIPSDMPLIEGKLTCITCHEIHSSPLNVKGERSYFLRKQEAGMLFCSSCHEINKSWHIDAIESAHNKARFTEKDTRTHIDPISLLCIQCHDSYIEEGTAYLGSGIWMHSTSSEHPIGISYEDASLEKWRKFRPPAMLDKAIRLYDGKIGCGTCHDIYSREKDKLVMNNRGSKLCLQCHIK